MSVSAKGSPNAGAGIELRHRWGDSLQWKAPGPLMTMVSRECQQVQLLLPTNNQLHLPEFFRSGHRQGSCPGGVQEGNFLVRH